jgi:hypothetical protein
MSGEDAPRPCLENLIVPEIKTNKQTRGNPPICCLTNTILITVSHPIWVDKHPIMVASHKPNRKRLGASWPHSNQE